MKKHYVALVFAVLACIPAASASALNMGLGSAPAATSTAKSAGKTEARITAAREKGVAEIARRTEALNTYNARVQAMVRLTVDQKASLEKFIQDQITALSVLKTKIEGDTDLETLKGDIKSITQTYRIFALVMPQAHITVASDKIQAAVEKLSTLESKLSVRIAEDKSSGKDVTALEALDTDMKLKIETAKTDASSAVSSALDMSPDVGDQSKAAANKKGLEAARDLLKTALKSVNDARKDAGDMISLLKGIPVADTLQNATSSTQ